ncbi:flagellar basal body P-ring protein FlgI [Candidatus Paraluminiphilus aquimaris]|uniref:Flagellar P-ring protein n=1 Tax=Candidatus Paraluminiphilus aquimaris TaxID=2518994 RepID=A0ABY6Q3G5_9GAMM|nr:flagellar basal body P-ring protein FlgI [Candidatus Paraluminiphilus aquimaris]UZP73789.1 flagellar basal body P-ring protein FlgI [Candidatus Paraluminiphilus aquimaris]
MLKRSILRMSKPIFATALGYLVLVLALTVILPKNAHAERIKDIAMVEGARSNQLVGFGLVVGLDGTGDQVTQTPFTIQAARSMLQQFGVNLPPGINPQTKNMASVMVTADLPPFAKPGQTVDVTVSSMGNAGSLRGGELLLTELKAGNGQIYAVAQGGLVVSGFGADGNDGSRISVNTKAAGRIPNGAMVEREVVNPFSDGSNKLTFHLHESDFTTARNMASAVNSIMGSGTATALDGVSVEVLAPTDAGEKVAYLAELENIEVLKAAAAAKVIVNARSGTIVIGSEVMVKTAAVAHGNLTVTIDESFVVSQPGPFASSAETVVLPQTEINIENEEVRMFVMEEGVSLQEIVTAVNRVGAAPGDLIAILEALQQAGALSAQLIVI